ncbi:MaoC/PaaZ C-terminal domain-containing protein [uncultured Roseobacter sp.]|uniref:MaoC family dehydratase n=1 Tax=uncultured Roseobacter sp. TaxID=114847 RepID=UPI00260840EB|nr:MaoC/PaaZ C-terminal domain-containing protein [uncultured Roseobacter sp.]
MTLKPGLYGFAHLSPGDRIRTTGRPITAAMIDDFAELSGDRYAIHMDDAAAQARGFAARVAHGLLILSLIDGLKNTAPARIDALASLGWTWDFTAPVHVGDMITATFQVAEKRTTSSGKRGIVILDVSVTNQSGDVVQSGQNRLIFDL